MHISIDISPISPTSAHRVRGVGTYVRELKNNLENYGSHNEYTFFENIANVPANTDIIHYPYFDPFSFAVPRGKKNKTIITIHDLTPLVFPKHFPVGVKGRLKWEVNKRSLKQVDAIITDSESSKRDIVRLTGIQQEKIHVVYLAADKRYKQMENGKWKMEIVQKYHLPKSFALYVGDATWNKNLPRVIHAIEKVKVPLVLAGKAITQTDVDISHSWNKDLVFVQQAVKGKNQLHALGFVDDEDLVALYNTATTLVMPSLYEGFGLPVLEAMQSGCPVVTSKEGSLPEVAGEAAYYVDASSVDSIAQGIQEVFSSESIRNELAKKGLEQAAKFSWEKTARNTVEVYEKVLRS